MEAQNSKTFDQTTDFEESQLINLIVTSFRGKSSQQVKQAEQQLIGSLNNPGFLERLVKILTARTEPYPNIKKSTALIIKKYSYQCSKSPGEKPILIQSIYKLLISDQLQFPAKEVLGTALSSLISVEKHRQYKNIILNNTLQLLSLDNSINKLDGCLIVVSSCFNTEDEEGQLEFFKTVLELISTNGMKLIKWLSNLTGEDWNAQSKPAMTRIVKIFQVLEDMIQQLTSFFTERENLVQLWHHPALVQLLHTYLLLFHNNNSIISTSFPPINEVKKIIMQIVIMLYKQNRCPEAIFKSIFFTFLAEAHTLVNNFEVEQILIKCLAVLESHLEKDLYNEIFSSNKLDTIFALLLYSVTNHEEYELIDQNPQKFVELAEDYTEANTRSDYLKVKAGIFLQVIVLKIDEALRNILQVVLMIGSEVLQTYKGSSVLVSQIKQVFSNYAFFRLSEELKLQTCLMVIALLSSKIHKRNDLSQLVGNFLISNFITMISISSNLVVLRIIRAVSYFPMSLYFLYIETQMSKSKVFILEGIKSFERILRTNKYPEVMKLLANIFSNLIGLVTINDPIMELIVLNCYESMLQVCNGLYRKIRNKIKQQFFINKQNNQHASLICFNLIYGLLTKEKNQTIRNQIISQFYEIVQYLLIPENSFLYLRYEQNLVEIFTLIISLRSFLSPEIQNFVEGTVRYLDKYQKGSPIFKLYNSYILHLEGAVFKLEYYFGCYWDQVKERILSSNGSRQKLQSIAYFCFLMSQIISNNSNLNLSQVELDQLFSLISIVPDQYKQYLYLIFLSFVYQYPHLAVKYLRRKQQQYQNFLSSVMSVEFNGLLCKKILILALIRLIEYEQNLNTFNVILYYCLQYLKLQSKRSKVNVYISSNQSRVRNNSEERATITYSPIEEEYNDNQLINLFVNFKHPYRSLSEFDNFKVILEHRHGFLRQLNPEVLKDIKEILQTQWIDSKTRKIVKVKA